MSTEAVGIDLGTTNSCVAAFAQGHAMSIRNQQGDATTPSCVAHVTGRVFVGKHALKDTYANVRVMNVKRVIGLARDDPEVTDDVDKLGWTLAAGDTKDIVIQLPDLQVTPVDVSAAVLGSLAASVRRHFNKGKDHVVQAVITVPAYFKYSQKRATLEAAKRAKIEVLKMINEPTAAALAVCYKSAAAAVVTALVFDLGGGTLDVTIVRLHAQAGVQGCAIDGDMHLGGVDFDSALARLLEQEGPKEWSDLDIKAKAIVCKHELSERDADGELALEAYVDIPNGQLTVSREKFDELVAGLYDKAMACVTRCIERADMTVSDIDTVVLVGGSSRLPRIRELLEAKFGSEKVPHVSDPDEIVAHGAAIAAAAHTGVLPFTLNDVAPHSVGIRTQKGGDDNVYSRIIHAGDTLPCELAKTYTIKANKSSVMIDVYEGENSVACENEPLDTFTIRFPAQAEEHEIEVSMKLEGDGVLRVDADVGGETEGITVNRMGQDWGVVVDATAFKEDDQSFITAKEKAEQGEKRKRSDE